MTEEKNKSRDLDAPVSEEVQENNQNSQDTQQTKEKEEEIKKNDSNTNSNEDTKKDAEQETSDKKKAEEKESVQDELAKPEETGNTTAAIQLTPEQKEMKHKIVQLSTFLEKLEAKDQASAEIRKVTNERISRLGEKIGEIKELFNVISSEKKDLEIKISQHAAIIRQIDPKQLLSRIESNRKDILSFQSDIQKLRDSLDQLQNNFERFESKIKVLDGEEEIIKLQDAVKKEFRSVTRLAEEANSHANTIENRFINFNKKVTKATSLFKEMTGLKRRMENISERVEDEIDHFKSNADSAVFEMVDELADLVSTGFDKLELRIKAVEKDTEKLNKQQNTTKLDQFKRSIASKFKRNQE